MYIYTNNDFYIYIYILFLKEVKNSMLKTVELLNIFRANQDSLNKKGKQHLYIFFLNGFHYYFQSV